MGTKITTETGANVSESDISIAHRLLQNKPTTNYDRLLRKRNGQSKSLQKKKL